jgi:hypothetical protein
MTLEQILYTALIVLMVISVICGGLAVVVLKNATKRDSGKPANDTKVNRQQEVTAKVVKAGSASSKAEALERQALIGRNVVQAHRDVQKQVAALQKHQAELAKARRQAVIKLEEEMLEIMARQGQEQRATVRYVPGPPRTESSLSKEDLRRSFDDFTGSGAHPA